MAKRRGRRGGGKKRGGGGGNRAAARSRAQQRQKSGGSKRSGGSRRSGGSKSSAPSRAVAGPQRPSRQRGGSGTRRNNNRANRQTTALFQGGNNAAAAQNQGPRNNQGSRNLTPAQIRRRDRREEQRPLIDQKVDNVSDYRFDKYRKSSVNSAELRNLRKQGFSRDEIADYARSQVDQNDGMRMGKGAARRLKRWDARSNQGVQQEPVPIQKPKEIEIEQPRFITPPMTQPVMESDNDVTFPTMPVNPVVQPPTVTPTPVAPPPMPSPTVPTVGLIPPPNVNPVQDNDMTQQIAQDNDIQTSIYGDGNYVSSQQDNSIRQYGGDNRQFTYVGSSNGGRYGGNHLDTPASMATLGGFYDVDDSPAKQAKFVDLHSTLNRDNQKRYANTGHIAQGAIHRAGMNQAVDQNALDTRIHNREQYSRAKADVMGMNVFGDMYAYTPPQYIMPEPQKPVQTPNFEEMYDKYTKF